MRWSHTVTNGKIVEQVNTVCERLEANWFYFLFQSPARAFIRSKHVLKGMYLSDRCVMCVYRG